MISRLLTFVPGSRQPMLTIGTTGLFDWHKVRVPLSTLNTHLYVAGKTGMGKSSFLLSLADQLIRSQQGLGLIDPHGDLVSDLLATLASYPRKRPWLSVPENRSRILYLDPRRDHVAPFNPLAAEHAEPYVIAQGVIEAFRRTWPQELAAAPRFANLALYALLVLIENRLSLMELPRLLPDKEYRERLLRQVTVPDVVAFFHNRFDRWGRDAPQSQRRKFFLIVDEFQKFTANEGSATTLAEILSECRKYGLHLLFAHQSWAQLSSHNRLSGALEQAQVQAIFGTGRQTAQALASSLYLPDPNLVKHEVTDPDSQERTHPLFETVQTQLEMGVQEIMRLKRRQVLVQLPEGAALRRLRTPTVPPSRVSRAQVERIKAMLARQSGRKRDDLTRKIGARQTDKRVPSVEGDSDGGHGNGSSHSLWTYRP